MGLANNVEDEVIDLDLSVIRKKRFRVDGDNNRILELNTSDAGIVNRLNEAYPRLQELAQKAAEFLGEEAEDDTVDGLAIISDMLKKTDAQMRKEIDYIFDAPVSEVCLPSGSMWDPHDGKFTFEWIIERIGKLYENNFTKEFNMISNRMRGHTNKYLPKK